MRYNALVKPSGEVIGVGTFFDVLPQIPGGALSVEIPAAFAQGLDPKAWRWDGVALVAVPAKPGPGYVFDYGGANQWVQDDTAERKEVRAERDARLAATDWMLSRALEQGVPLSQEMLDYRQALRDVPEQTGFPLEVVWPVPPV